MSQSILVTGGAGYIGSHVLRDLVEKGYSLTVIDNLSTGFTWALPKKNTELVVGDVRDYQVVSRVAGQKKYAAVIHLAALTQVEESTRLPYLYYEVNTVGTGNVLKAMVEHQLTNLIFSSTAAVYGSSLKPVVETDSLKPINPYGSSKLLAEEMIRFHHECHGDFKFVNLRYFNVAGAHPSGDIGQATKKATHLIKVAVETALGKRECLEIFGSDYDTFDGTCVRDYIHVWDLARAHTSVLQYLLAGGQSDTFNVGYGQGFSVQQVIKAVEKESGRALNVKRAARRNGDSVQVVANVDKINRVLNLHSEFTGALNRICASALNFEKRHI